MTKCKYNVVTLRLIIIVETTNWNFMNIYATTPMNVEKHKSIHACYVLKQKYFSSEFIIFKAISPRYIEMQNFSRAFSTCTHRNCANLHEINHYDDLSHRIKFQSHYIRSAKILLLQTTANINKRANAIKPKLSKLSSFVRDYPDEGARLYRRKDSPRAGRSK